MSAVAAAELERQKGCERGRRRWKRGRMKKGQSCLFIRRRLISGREKRGDQNMVIQLPRRLDFQEGIKDKDPVKYDVVAGF